MHPDDPRPEDIPTAYQASELPPPGSSPVKRRGRTLFWGVLSGCLIVFVLITALGVVGAVMSSDGGTGMGFLPIGKVAVLPLEGPIYDSREFVEQLEEYGESATVRAIVIRIDSPGGLVVPSQEMNEAIRRVRAESGKPVVASIANAAASGGYYVAVACDPIIANRGSITGSIGVIAQWFNYEELARWAKLDPHTIKSGRWKDVPNPLRELDAEERLYYQSLLDQLHEQFIAAVVEGRKGKLTAAQVAQVADGRVFIGEQALQLKLVDELGTLNDAIEAAGEAAGLGDDPAVYYPRPPSPGLLDVLGGAEGRVQSVLNSIGKLDDIQFMYRWN